MIRFFKILSFSLLFIFSISYASSSIKIKVNNTSIKSDVEPFIKSGTTYVPIRFVADALNVDSVQWNSDAKSISIKNSGTSILLFINQNYTYVNDEYKTLNNNPLLLNSRAFVPLRFVSEILGANVNWDENNSTVLITTKKTDTIISKPSSNTSSNNLTSTATPNTTPSTTKPNNNSSALNQYKDEVYWLARIIEAEAGGEPFNGKVAVGEVILNRVECEEFPDTIWGVIFDKKFGTQFEPVSNGTIYNTPSESSIQAAETALSGSNYIEDCLYFLNPTIASSNWITKNREFYTTIANHDFYI